MKFIFLKNIYSTGNLLCQKHERILRYSNGNERFSNAFFGAKQQRDFDKNP